MNVQNSEIAKIFYEISDLLEIEGENPFRIRAYRDAARTIEGYSRRVNKMVREGESLQDIPGIGEDLAEKIKEIVETGELLFLEELHARTPQTLIELLGISGLGPKRVQQLYNELGIKNIEELKKALNSGKVANLDGFGEKSVANIREAIESKSLDEKRTRLDIAEQFVKPLVDYLKTIDTVEKAAIAGSYRRRRATVGDLDIVAVSEKGKAVIDAFTIYDSIDEVLSKGETKASVILRSGLQVDLRVVTSDSFGAAMLYFTGSKAHNVHLRKMAIEQDMKINEYGVYEDDERIAGETEEEIYELLEMQYVHPEMREDTGEIEAALKGKLPELVRLEDIRGDLQVHTKASDGKNTIEEIASAAQDLGYEYIAITDHSAYIGVTNGLKEEDIEGYIEKIDKFNQEHKGIRVLKGIEVDIHKDGELDLSNDTLSKLDFVLGAIHSHFDLNEEEQTKRFIKALENPLLNSIAHPTTRRIGSRDPIKINFEEIMKAASNNGCFLEINANPERLDLWDQHIRLAGEMSVKLVISTDSHSISGLKNMSYGVFQARRGWAAPSQIINTLPLKDVMKILRKE